MNDLLRAHKALLPWLFPLTLLLVVIAVAFAPSAVAGLVGAVVFLGLGYVGVPLYYLRSKQREDRYDIPR